MKRIFVLFLSLVMVLSILPPLRAQASSEADIRSAVDQEFNKLLNRVSPGESAYDGTFQLLNHALFGGGEDLIMDESDPFTGLAFHSNMVKDTFVPALTEMLQEVAGSGMTRRLGDLNLAWYDNNSYYTVFGFKGDQIADGSLIPDKQSEERQAYNALCYYLIPRQYYKGTFSSYDKTMVLLAGGLHLCFTIQQTSADSDTVQYHVDIKLRDEFNFDANYDKFQADASLARALKWFGKLMELGAVVKTFYWECNLDFDITLPNDCFHQSSSYRWEFDGDNASIPANAGYSANQPTRLTHASNNSDEEVTDPYYYRLDWPISLKHDIPWTLEYQTTQGGIYFGPNHLASSDITAPQLFHSYSYVVGGDGQKRPDPEKPGEFLASLNWYGIRVTDHNIRIQDKNTYRLQNVCNPDGSNMVYLSVNGQTIGAMDHAYFRNEEYQVSDLEKSSSWFQGKDFDIRYLFNLTARKSPNIDIDYIQIWENGADNAPASYVTSQTIAPQPGSQGYQLHTCSKCGAGWKDSFTAALPDGLAGAWETDITLSAADLGVNTPDARLRCILTFGADGTVKADWKAIDLSAFREFYHTLFVNAYYACAYGAGMTDLSQVEQTCLETNGMSVSDYIYSFLDSFDINALFTPAPSSGTYKTQDGQLYTDLPIMGKPSDADTPNPYALNGSALTWTAASYGLPDYMFHCTKK